MVCASMKGFEKFGMQKVEAGGRSLDGWIDGWNDEINTFVGGCQGEEQANLSANPLMDSGWSEFALCSILIPFSKASLPFIL